jgi:hypothetical protein
MLARRRAAAGGDAAICAPTRVRTSRLRQHPLLARSRRTAADDDGDPRRALASCAEDSITFEDEPQRFPRALDAGLARWRDAMAPYAGTRVVVDARDWPYFAERFGLQIVGAPSRVPGVPPTPSEIGALIERMRAAERARPRDRSHSDMALVNQIAHGSVARVVSSLPRWGEPGPATTSRSSTQRAPLSR